LSARCRLPAPPAADDEINLPRCRARRMSGLDTRPEHVAAFEHHIGEHPILNHFTRDRSPQPCG
jgi:hypothetical protein